jgi:hypothetical protein
MKREEPLKLSPLATYWNSVKGPLVFKNRITSVKKD